MTTLQLAERSRASKTAAPVRPHTSLELGGRATSQLAYLLRLQHIAGNQAVSRLIQRCGPIPCNCDSKDETEPGQKTSEAQASLQRKPKKSAAKPAKSTPTLGTCKPVQDDLKPAAPWADLQKGFKSRCATAEKDVADQLGKAADDILNGRVPRTPHLPDARSSVDCVCANMGPREAAVAAAPVVGAAGPLALGLYMHFLGASGSTEKIDVADMIKRSAGVRAKIKRSIARAGMVGTTRIEQSEYGDRELQFAYGAIDCVQWRALAPAKKSWRSNMATRIEVSMLDYYEFHPGRLGVSQCAHAACVELVALGQAKNFWTSGVDVVTWADLQ